MEFFQDEPNEYKSKLLLYTKFDISTYFDIEWTTVVTMNEQAVVTMSE